MNSEIDCPVIYDIHVRSFIQSYVLKNVKGYAAEKGLIFCSCGGSKKSRLRCQKKKEKI